MNIEKFGPPIDESLADNLAFSDQKDKEEALPQIRETKMRMEVKFLTWFLIIFGIMALTGLIYLYTLIRSA